MAPKQGTPLWITLGCGCCLLTTLAIAAAVAAGYFGVSALKGYVEDMKDPAARTARAGEILGAKELPEGYTAQLFLSIPWIFDLVILTDGEPLAIAEEEDVDLDAATVGEHLFLFLKLRKNRMDDEEIDSMLRGQRTSDGVHADVGLELDPDEELSRGAFELASQRLRYVAHRGELELDDDLPGIFSRLIVECPDDDLTRVAVWFQHVPRDAAGEAPAVFAGSPADEAALKSFMGHFDLCAR